MINIYKHLCTTYSVNKQQLCLNNSAFKYLTTNDIFIKEAQGVEKTIYITAP